MVLGSRLRPRAGVSEKLITAGGVPPAMPTVRLDSTGPPAPGQAIRVSAEGHEVAVFNLAGRLFAIDAKCTHVGGPLDKGSVDGHVVSCPWHGSRFDVENGQVVRGPAVKPLHSYSVRAEGAGLVLEIP